MMEVENLLESELALVLPSDNEDDCDIVGPDMDTFPEGSRNEVINPPRFYKIMLNFPPFGSFPPFLNSTDRFCESSRTDDFFLKKRGGGKQMLPVQPVIRIFIKMYIVRVMRYIVHARKQASAGCPTYEPPYSSCL